MGIFKGYVTVFIMTGDLSPFIQEGNRIEAAWGKTKSVASGGEVSHLES